MGYQYVLYEKKGQIVTITMNRPERRNAWGWEFVRDLRMAFQEFQADADAVVAILTGKGAAFSSGRDLKQAAEMSNASEQERTKIQEEMNRWNAFDLRWSDKLKPFVTAVNGYAIGGGFMLAYAGLLRVAAQSATFQLSEINLGGSMAGWELMQTQNVPLCVATEIALGRRISAQRAYDAGLLNKVVTDAELMPAAMEMAEYITGLPPLALKYTLDGLRRSRGVVNPALSELQTLRTRKELQGSEDTKEAARAFAEKRKPVFKGR